MTFLTYKNVLEIKYKQHTPAQSHKAHNAHWLDEMKKRQISGV